MRTVELPSGRKVKITVRHDHGGGPNMDQRFTWAAVLPEDADPLRDQPIASAAAYCSHDDTFVRATGRKLAMLRINEQLRALGWTRADRRAVCQKIF